MNVLINHSIYNIIMIYHINEWYMYDVICYQPLPILYSLYSLIPTCIKECLSRKFYKNVINHPLIIRDS